MPLIKPCPQAAGVAVEPDWKQDRDGERRCQHLFRSQFSREAEDRVRNQRQHRGDAIVEIDRTEEEAWFTLDFDFAMRAILVHGNDATEEFAFAAHWAA